MSKVAIQGNASGSGVLTVAAPNTNSDFTLTLPAETGTVLTSGGAIDVNASAPADSLVIDNSGVIKANSAGTSEVFAQNTVKVWGAFSSASVAFYNSFGTSSISKTSTGIFQVNFARTLSSSRFGMAGATYADGKYVTGGGETTTGTQVRIYDSSGSLSDSDCQFIIAGGS